MFSSVMFCFVMFRSAPFYSGQQILTLYLTFVAFANLLYNNALYDQLDILLKLAYRKDYLLYCVSHITVIWLTNSSRCASI